MTTVVAISGMSGSGKTTVTNELKKHLKCHAFYFDDHVDTHTYPVDMHKWTIEGADLSKITNQGLFTVLAQHIKHTSDKFTLVEEPFGQARPEIAPLIDKTILLDTLPEVCLSRIVQRHMSYYTAEQGEQCIKSLSHYLKKYDNYFKHAYTLAADQTKQVSDLIVDGKYSSPANAIIKFLTKTTF